MRWFTLIVVLLVLPVSLIAQAGGSGMAFLKLGVSGHGTAMADAVTASVSGAAATYYNPAGILPVDALRSSTELLVMHKEWIQDTRTEFLGAAIGLGENSAMGLSVNTTSVSDIEIRLRPGESQGSFTARNFAAGLSYATRVTESVQVGLTGKFLYEKILVDEASGYAIDLGTQVRTPIENLVAGVAIANLGSMSEMRNEKTTLPALFRAGAAYLMKADENVPVGFVGGADIVYIFPEKRWYPSVGLDVSPLPQVSVRGGYQFGSEGRGLSAGIGIRQSIFTVDYAFTRLSSDLGNGHTISLALAL